MKTIYQQIEARAGDTVRVIIAVVPQTVGTLSIEFDTLNVELSENYDTIHKITTENPTLYLNTSDDCDGYFVSASVEAQVFSGLIVD